MKNLRRDDPEAKSIFQAKSTGISTSQLTNKPRSNLSEIQESQWSRSEDLIITV